MRILHLTSEYPPFLLGGLGTHVTELTKALSEIENINITVCAWKYPTAADTKLSRPNKVSYMLAEHIFDYSPINGAHEILLSNFGVISKVLSENKKFDIIHAHDFVSGYAGLTLKQILKIPFVVTLHDTILGRTKSLGNQLTPFNELFSNTQIGLVNNSNLTICVSSSLKDEIKSLYKVEHNNIKVVHNGITPLDIKKENYYLNKQIKILFLGRFAPEKGIVDLIDAVYQLRNEGIDILLNLVGRINNYAHELGKKIDTLNLNDCILFKGFLSGTELTNEIINSDLCVIPSWYEPFGIVAIEACSLGLPVIATDVGGLGETIKNEVTGIKIPSKHPESIIKACKRLIQDDNLRIKLGTSARKYVNKNYTWNHIAKKTLVLYEKLLNNN